MSHSVNENLTPTSRRRAKIVAFGIVSAGWVGSAFSAQQATGARKEEGRAGAAGREQPPTLVHNEAAQDVGAAMRRNGSSLLKATMNARPERGQANIADVSFAAVPEPVPRTVRKHDHVTIIVREESDFRSRGTSQLKKQAAFEAKVDEFIRLRLRNLEIEGGAQGASPPGVSVTGKRDFKGEGVMNRSESFTTRVQAEVLDVKPNGTLVLQARSRVRNDDEDRHFILTGTCRVEDISADNTILSSQLYDKSISNTTSGTVRQATRRGWLSNLLDVISPF